MFLKEQRESSICCFVLCGRKYCQKSPRVVTKIYASKLLRTLSFRVKEIVRLDTIFRFPDRSRFYGIFAKIFSRPNANGNLFAGFPYPQQ